MGRGVIWGAWALAAISSACLPSAATTCDDGSLCPAGTVCLSTGGCALAAQVEACADAVDGAACSFPGAPDGVCASGVCSVPRCGNGLLEFGEVCDDGNAAFGDGCSPRCDSDEACGNGVIDALIGEQCDCGDDAAALPPGCAQPNGDAPGSICRAGCVAVGCGDGVVAAPEDCEGADLAGGACTDLGFYSGELACLPSCRYDTSACVGLCGDGVLDDAEACDTVSEESCADYGLAFGRPTCNGACGVDTRDCGRADWVRVFAAGGMTIGRGVRDEADRYYFSDANDRVLIYTPGEGVTERAAPFSPSYIDGSSSTDLWIAGNQVARWDGASWTTTWSPGAFEYVADLALAGPGLPVIAGNFYGSGTGDVGFVERWDGVAWTRLVDDIPTWMTSHRRLSRRPRGGRRLRRIADDLGRRRGRQRTSARHHGGHRGAVLPPR
jgi:cysteine-rich repeat protein